MLEQRLRSHLGSFGITGNLALQSMYTLSGFLLLHQPSISSGARKFEVLRLYEHTSFVLLKEVNGASSLIPLNVHLPQNLRSNLWIGISLKFNSTLNYFILRLNVR